MILSILMVAAVGVTVVNRHWNESWKLFYYDLKNGFAGFGWLYIAALAAVAVAALATALALWWLLQRKNHYKLRIYKAVCVLLLAVCAIINIQNIVKSSVKCEWKPTKTIGHSFGAVNEVTYTNSWEAFEENYAQGRRVVEADMLLTSDNRLVLKHDWDTPVQEGISEEHIPDEEAFLNAKLDGKYTPMSFEQLCGIMIEYPDLWVVTDTKYTQEDMIIRQFDVMVDTIKNTGNTGILDRLIIQVYNEQMYELLNERYDFKTYLFTMYKRFYTDDTVEIFRDVCRYCVSNGINLVGVKYRRYDNYGNELQKIADTYDIKLYVYTVNDPDAAEEIMDAGVAGIYTDSLYDSDLQTALEGK